MRRLRVQFTIRQLMLTVGSVGLILALVVSVLRGDEFATVFLLFSPGWGPFVLAFMNPRVTRWLFWTACLLAIPLGGYFSIRFANATGVGSLLSLGLVLLVPCAVLAFGLGHILSKENDLARKKNRAEGLARGTRSESWPPSSP
jgi:hypothetical protein